ncbi:unnamed protein product [Bathycoccus prasinos]
MKRAMCNLKCYQKTGRVHRSKSADIIAQDDAECIVLQKYEDAPNRNFILGELNKFKALEDQDVLVNKLIFLKSKEVRLKENREKYHETNAQLKYYYANKFKINRANDYDTANTRALGRLYPAGASLQYLGKDYRKALVCDEYTDIDIANAHPSLINQVFKKENIECKMLNDYVENREKFLEVADKTEWTALLNNRVPNEKASDLEKAYWNDVISCALKLFERPFYTTYLKKGEKRNPSNKLGWAISQLATDRERDTVSAAMMCLVSLGYSLGTLIHDGFLVEDLSVRDEDLREAEKYTEEATGYLIQLVRKPLTDFNREEVFGSDDEIEENGDTLGGDRENAEAFLKWMTDEGHAFVRNGKEVWWYCPENGVYSQDLMGLRMFMGDCPLLDDEYRCMTKKQDNMKVQFMEMIPNDSELYEKMFHSTYRKLAFQNGIYDFEKEMLVEFSPEYFFTFKAPVDLKLKSNEKMKNEVYQKLFVDVFGDPDVRKGELNYAVEEKAHDKAQYYLKVLARAIAAEIYGKDFFVVVGEGNSGKGTNTDALFGAFGKFVDNINAGCLTKKLGDDAAKARSWMVAIKNTRIVVANEVSMDVSLDASVIKTLSSGGDAITARQNYANESTFRLQTTAICFVNDMPNIKGVDDATTNRLKYLETSYSYLEGELYEKQKQNKNVRKADPTLKREWLKRKDVLEAFASLVVGAYERNKPVAPECVVKASREWTETDDWKEKFTGLFEATGNDGDEMAPKEVYKIAKDNGILASENKMSRMMTQIGFTTTSITRRGKRVRYYKGVKEMDDSRGWVGY